MHVEAQRVIIAGNAGGFVQLYASPNSENPETVPINSESRVDFLDMQAIVHWSAVGERAECSFENVWLETRIDDEAGWVHGQEAFETLGLPNSNPR